MTDILASPYSVEIWTRAQSVDHLVNTLGWTDIDADAVAEQLADFAPAVRLVAAVVLDGKWSSTKLLDRLAKSTGVDRINRAATASVDLVEARIFEVNDNPRLVRHSFAYLAAFAYVPSLFSASIIPRGANFFNALNPFYKLDLLTSTDNLIRFDPVLQWAVRNLETSKGAGPTDGIDNALNYVDMASKGKLPELLPVVDAVIGHADAASSWTPHGMDRAAKLAYRLSRHFEDSGSLARAIDYYRQCVAFKERRYGEAPDEDLALSLFNLGGMLRKAGDLAAARDCFRRACDIGETTLGLRNATLGVRYAMLGRTLYEMKDLTGARDAYARGVMIGEITLHAQPPTVEEPDPVDEPPLPVTAGEALLRYAVDGTTLDDIRKVLGDARTQLFADDTLDELAGVLGIDEECARACMRYLSREGLTIDGHPLERVAPAKAGN